MHVSFIGHAPHYCKCPSTVQMAQNCYYVYNTHTATLQWKNGHQFRTNLKALKSHIPRK
jgi:hypothetical protein